MKKINILSITIGLVCLVSTASYAQMRSSIEQYGITWTFDKEYETGQFVNGDWWVKTDNTGLVNVVHVDPATILENGKTIHGSMINPSSKYQGYDERGGTYSSDPIYRGNLTVQFPTSLLEHSSLVSAISWRTGEPREPDINDLMEPFSIMRTIAVLTVVSEVPPIDAFRPPYFGNQKPIFRESNMDYSILPALLPPQYIQDSGYDFDDIGSRPLRGDKLKYPTIADRYKKVIERPWMMHLGSAEVFRGMAPTDNQSNYYRETFWCMMRIALMLTLDLDKIYTLGTKRKLIIPMVQLGIDSYYTYESVAGPGIHKQLFPILFAGKMLNNINFLKAESSMVEQPHSYYNIYYREQSTGLTDNLASKIVPSGSFYHGYSAGYRVNDFFAGLVGYEELSPGPTYNPITHRHTSSECGEWGWLDKYTAEPYPEGYYCWAEKREAYRKDRWYYSGLALAVHLLGLRDAWNHPAFFDYGYRWNDQLKKQGIRGWDSPFDLKMWDAHGYLPLRDVKEPIWEHAEPENDVIEQNSLTIKNNIIKNKPNDLALISCYVKESEDLKIAIYDSKGKELIVLLDGYKEAGEYNLPWNGTDSSGKRVGSGVYMVHMRAGSYKETKKIVVVK